MRGLAERAGYLLISLARGVRLTGRGSIRGWPTPVWYLVLYLVLFVDTLGTLLVMRSVRPHGRWVWRSETYLLHGCNPAWHMRNAVTGRNVWLRGGLST